MKTNQPTATSDEGTPTVLVVDPDSTSGRFIVHLLQSIGYEAEAVQDLDDVNGITDAIGCVLLDDSAAAAGDFKEAIGRLSHQMPGAPAIAMIASGDWMRAADAMRWGAYVTWPKTIDIALMRKMIDGALRKHVEAVEGEAAIIRHTLEDVGGNRRKAAEALGISEQTLYRRLNQYGIERKRREVAVQ